MKKMKKISDLKIKIFADSADKANMLKLNSFNYIKGLTTNPTLMKKAGIKDYKTFALEILSEIKEKPISFEVFSDDFAEMQHQAFEIASWGLNVYVKIPITNTQNIPCHKIVKTLSNQGIKLNITAIMNIDQMRKVLDNLNPRIESYISIFAGRIADTGRDPIPLMIEAITLLKKSHPKSELIWASPREILNIFQADEINCHIITVTNDILKKINLIGYALEDYSLDTVKMFYSDALEAGYKID